MSLETASNLLHDRRVVVFCGAGGVGKTTTSAAAALAAARQGRRVLVVTIDPSRRLAQTLGVSPHAPEPVALDAERLSAIGVDAPGSLSAWMLDPKAVSDRLVRRLAPDEKTAERLLANRVYRNVTAMVAGMQEYMAVEALHGFVQSDRYDLVVLDTPPSRDALRFLDAPSRATAFFDRRIFRLFVPGAENPVRRAASRMLEGLLDLAFGKRARQEIQHFFQLFEQVLTSLGRSQGEMRTFFAGDRIRFVLVTSPRPDAIEEARYFEAETRRLSLRLGGYVLNRSRADAVGRPMPSEIELPPHADPALRSGLAKLEPLARREAEQATEDEALRAQLAARTPGLFALALPELPSGASELEALVTLADEFERA